MRELDTHCEVWEIVSALASVLNPFNPVLREAVFVLILP